MKSGKNRIDTRTSLNLHGLCETDHTQHTSNMTIAFIVTEYQALISRDEILILEYSLLLTKSTTYTEIGSFVKITLSRYGMVSLLNWRGHWPNGLLLRLPAVIRVEKLVGTLELLGHLFRFDQYRNLGN